MTKHTVLTRTTTIVALFVSVFGLGSCTKHVTQVVDQGFSALYTIKPTDWQLDNSGLINAEPTYVVSLNVPEIDDKVVQNGGVFAYLSFDKGDPVTYEQLPETYGGLSYATTHANGKLNILYWNPGSNQAPPLPLGNVHLKVVILDATPLD
ncbi:MAG: hypothetical protein J0H74_07735 [Chitinophagaceae bacterium]|nr:hypothetical protein [Chitinophagaceae bacterium]